MHSRSSKLHHRKVRRNARREDVEWTTHEQQSPAIAIEAQRLVDFAGSLALAHAAVDQAREPGKGADAELSSHLGFRSPARLRAASIRMHARGGEPWFITSSGNAWVVWREGDTQADNRFETLDAALDWLDER